MTNLGPRKNVARGFSEVTKMFTGRSPFSPLRLLLMAAGLAVIGWQIFERGHRASDDTTLVLRAVGPLYVGGYRSCSAVLISDHEVITAAHCVYAPAPPHRASLKGLYVLIGPRGTGFATLRGVISVATLPGYSHGPGERLTLDQLGFDAALLVLDAPVTPDEALPLPVAVWGAATEAQITGYPRDVNDETQRQGCPVQMHQGDVTQIGCAVVTGLSGAAVTIAGVSGPEVVAVVSSRLGDDAHPAALVVSIAPLLTELRANLK